MDAPRDRRPQPRVCRAADRFTTVTDWVESAHSFSFGAHYDPANVGFGRLMVNNHERLSSGAGYDDHRHTDAEIVTWMLSGSLVHADSTGHRGVVRRGLAQRLSAGRGVVHAERNDAFRADPAAPRVPAEYVQMWVRPDEPGGDPSYAQADFDERDLVRGWVAVASGREAALVRVGAAATLWATVLAAGVTRPVPAAALVHLYLARGWCRLDARVILEPGDAVRFPAGGPATVTGLPGDDPAELLVWQLDR